MSEHKITIESGTSKRLPIGGKYSENDVIVTAIGGTAEDLDSVLTEQETLISELKSALRGKASGEEDFENLLTNKLTDLDSNVTSIRQFAFRGATALTSINLPKATSIATNAFYGCTKLTSVNMPLVKSIGENVFNGCSILPSIVLPSLTTGDSYMFRYCYQLKTIDLPVIANLVNNMFGDCRRLTAVILRKTDAICTLANTSAFYNCYHFHGTTNSTYNPNGAKDGYIYVPSALVEEYKAATNWSTFATQIRAIEGSEYE